MLTAVLALALLQQDPTDLPTPPQEPAPSPRIEATASGSEIEVLHLGEDRQIRGTVVKETADAIYVDLGFDIVRVPIAAVVRRSTAERRVTRSHDEGIFRTADLPELPVAAGARTVGPAVVKIETPTGSGSGFLTSPEGYVVTNFHVVAGASRVLVGFDDQVFYEATVVGVAPDKDLAVLAVRAPKGHFKPIPVGRSADLQVGQRVLAIGNPFGLDHSLTTGVVSALDRTIQAMTGRPIEGVIQTDASINPGNSGGPLLDSAGRLIGVNTAIQSPTGTSAGIGFAVPVDTVNRVVPQLIAYGKVVRPSLGIRVAHDQRVAALGMQGVLVLAVVPGGPAEAAGLRGVRREGRRLVLGDLIVAVGDRAVRTNDDLLQALEAHDPGAAVTVRFLRGEAALEAQVRLAAPQP
ncbi:MAG: trypsin-like peptidase domain-containing protein [Myxococcales bacterium]|nr:trypsin-like peptidase domain-containing protein [Myxococcales bacterium]